MSAFERHSAAVRARVRGTDLVRPGPGSVTWKIMREIVVVAGWGRAVLLQLAHPAIAAGVRDHSAVGGGLRKGIVRLHSTVGAMLDLTFGDTERMIAAVAGIHAIHDRVNGRDDHGRPYSAHDAGPQRWVHATLLESIPLAYELTAGPLTAGEKDQYCAEAAFMEPMMGIPSGSLPRDWAQLDAYMRGMEAGSTIAVNDTSRALARTVLYPPAWHMLWPAMRPIQLMTIGTLPAAIREAYGFEWRDRDARALARWTSLMRASRHVLPAAVREWPIARRHRLSDRMSAWRSTAVRS